MDQLALDQIANISLWASLCIAAVMGFHKGGQR